MPDYGAAIGDLAARLGFRLGWGRYPDGAEVRYTSEEMLCAVSATIRQVEHRLLPYTRQMDTKEGMPGLIRAIEGSRCLSEADG